MTSIDDLQRDVKGVSDTILGDLSTEERIRIFAKKAAEGDEERIEQLADTAPQYEYTATDLEYLNGIKKLGAVSMQARYELQVRYQAITEHEETRNKYVALLLLNESLSRLSRGAFEIDEFGNFDAPDHDNAEYAYGEKQAPDMAYVATKYRELWDDVPAEFLIDERDRAGTIEVFPALAAAGSFAYRSDLSGEAFDDLERDRVSSEVHSSELRLLNTLAEFHTRFNGWRLFAEEQLEITLGELLDVSAPEEHGKHIHGISVISEDLCENTLSIYGDYLEAYPTVLEELAGEIGKDVERVDLDERARNYADGLADAVDLP